MKQLKYILLAIIVLAFACKKEDVAIGGNETLVVTVKIPDSTGNGSYLPISGAVVKLYLPSEEKYEVSQTTGKDGKCIFQYLKENRYKLKTETIRKEGEYFVNFTATKEVQVDAGVANSTELLLQAEPQSRSGLLYIHTVAENGTPLEGVSVCLFSTQQEFETSTACTSDNKSSGGKYPGIRVFSGLQPGQPYYVKARRQTGSTVLLGELVFTYADSGSAIHQTVTLSPDPANKEGRLEIKLVNEQGIPQAPESICMYGSREEFLDTAYTCSNTNLVFTGLVTGKTYYFKAGRQSGSLRYIAADSVVFDPASPKFTMTFRLQSPPPPAGALTVQVFAPSGAPQPDATVCILYSRQELNDTLDCAGPETGPNGKVSIANLSAGHMYYIKALRRPSANVMYEAKDSLIYQPGLTKTLHLK